MVIEGRSYLFTDATVNIDPDAETLSEIAILANDFALTLGLAPRVAMLSFSNFGATPHPLSNKVRRAVEIVRSRRPDITVDGEMQADTAVVVDIIEARYPSAASAMQRARLPQSGRGQYLLQAAQPPHQRRSHRAHPARHGRARHVLQAGDDVEDIVAIAAVAAMDAHGRGG